MITVAGVAGCARLQWGLPQTEIVNIQTSSQTLPPAWHGGNSGAVFRGVLAPLMMLLPLLLARPAQAREGCTDRDFIGAFGFFGTGTVIRSPVTDLTGPFARLGRFESDGNGKLIFSSTASFNGILIPQDFTGVYKMHPDCTFNTTVFLPDPINLRVNFEGMLSDNGDEMRDLFVSPPGLVIHGPGRKMKLSACTNRDLAGTFHFEIAGSILQPDRSRMPFSALGRITADGAGGFSGKLGSNFGGLTAVGEKISGTYTVASTCLFEMKYYTADEGRGPNDGVKLKGVLIDGGKAAFVMILEPSIATVLGGFKRQ